MDCNGNGLTYYNIVIEQYVDSYRLSLKSYG